VSGPLRFHRVLVGADGSDASADALVLARRLVEPDGELVLATIRERGFRRHPTVQPPAPERGERIAEHAASSAARGLAELAEAERADLIVLGAHGGFDGRTSPGPTALRLLHGGPCAVAVAPRGAREAAPIRHVGAAYDASPEAAAALASAYALAARTGAAMSIFSTWLSTGPGVGSFDPDVVSDVLQLRRSEVQDRLDAAAETAPADVNPPDGHAAR
jgi:nucleotide-binding universal stress UspA family protein